MPFPGMSMGAAMSPWARPAAALPPGVGLGTGPMPVRPGTGFTPGDMRFGPPGPRPGQPGFDPGFAGRRPMANPDIGTFGTGGNAPTPPGAQMSWAQLLPMLQKMNLGNFSTNFATMGTPNLTV